MTANIHCYCFLFLCSPGVKTAEKCQTRCQSREEITLDSFNGKEAQNMSFSYHYILTNLFPQNGAVLISTERKTLQLLCGQLFSWSVTSRPEVMTFQMICSPSEASEQAWALFMHAYYLIHKDPITERKLKKGAAI